MHKVTSYGDFLVFAKNSIENIWCYDRFHMMDFWGDFFCPENVAHWVHRCPNPYRHLLAGLGDSVGCCYTQHVELFGRCCAGIALRDQTSLHQGWCTVSYFPPFVGWGSMNHSP